MPGEITGSLVQTEDRKFTFRRGPVFHNILLADEINRTSPKTQAALLEAMQEHQVTCDGTSYKLPEPFIVLATQNPLDSAGTYPLPDAQLDRFAIKIDFPELGKSELRKILRGTTSTNSVRIEPVLPVEEAAQTIKDFQALVRRVNLTEEVEDSLLSVWASLQPEHEEAIPIDNVSKYVEYGPSPRGAQAVVLLAKVFALFDGRTHVSVDDVKEAYIPALNHRIYLRPEAFPENVDAFDIIDEVVSHVHGS